MIPITAIRPLRDWLLVQVDDSMPNESNLIVPVATDKWREADDQIGHRGTVIRVGPGPSKAGRQNSDSVMPMPLGVKAGDRIRFSELEYKEFKQDGKRYLMIQEGDIVGVEPC